MNILMSGSSSWASIRAIVSPDLIILLRGQLLTRAKVERTSERTIWSLATHVGRRLDYVD